MQASALPEYQKPPVVEVVYGITFKPLEQLMAPQLGYLADLFKDEYPQVQEHPPLASVLENLDGDAATNVEFGVKVPLPRVWFLKPDESVLLQFQRDRFIQNWRKVRDEDAYPRYVNIIDAFDRNLGKLREFVSELGIGQLSPIQYEMTYINHIPKGEGWNSYGEMGSILPDFAWRNGDRFLPNFEVFNWHTAFLLPNKQGRLRVIAGAGKRTADNTPTISLELTVRGFNGIASLDSYREWFDTAREWIVRGFTDLTSERMQKDIWLRTR